MAKKSSSSKSTKSNSKVRDIRFIRLNNGEDIVSEVLDVSNGKILISNPLKILYTPSLNTGYLSISLMQWVFTRISREQTFHMDITNVLVMSKPEDTLIHHYEESVENFKLKLEDNTEFDTLDNEEGLEMLKSLMNKIKNNKGRLN